MSRSEAILLLAAVENQLWEIVHFLGDKPVGLWTCNGPTGNQLCVQITDVLWEYRAIKFRMGLRDESSRAQ